MNKEFVTINDAPDDVKVTNCNDKETIYKQDAIDIVDKYFKKIALNGDICIDGLMSLPSAQPESCEDAVSRQRLLSDLKELVAAWKKYPVMAEQVKGVETAIGYVEAISSVQPEKRYTKADYIMALHKEYGCNFAKAEKAHDKALEYLRDITFIKG